MTLFDLLIQLVCLTLLMIIVSAIGLAVIGARHGKR